MSAQASHEPPSPATIAAAGLLALASAMGVGRFAFTPILPMMQADFGLAIRDGGWLAGANYAGYLAGSLAALRSRAPAVATLAAALLAVALATAAMALTRDFAAWLALRFAAGVASAFALVFVTAWALQGLARAGRPGLRGVVFSGVGVGIAACGLACMALARLGLGAVHAWLLLGLASLAVAAWIGLSPSLRTPPTSAAPPSAPAGARHARLARLIACYGAFGFAYILPATFLPAMARASLGEASLFDLAWPVFGAAAALSTLLVGACLSSARPRDVWIGANLVMAAGLLAVSAGSSLPLIVASSICVGGTFMVITMAAMQEASAVAGPDPRGAIAAMTAAFAAGQIVGPIAIASLPPGDSVFQAAMAAAALLLVASSLALVHPPSSPQPPKGIA